MRAGSPPVFHGQLNDSSGGAFFIKYGFTARVFLWFGTNPYTGQLGAEPAWAGCETSHVDDVAGSPGFGCVATCTGSLPVEPGQRDDFFTGALSGKHGLFARVVRCFGCLLLFLDLLSWISRSAQRGLEPAGAGCKEGHREKPCTLGASPHDTDHGARIKSVCELSPCTGLELHAGAAWRRRSGPCFRQSSCRSTLLCLFSVLSLAQGDNGGEPFAAEGCS